MNKNTIVKKLDALCEILKILQYRDVCKDDKELLTYLNCHERTLERYLEDLQKYSYILINTKKGIGKKGRNKKCYKLLKPNDILKSFLNHSDDLDFFIEMGNSFDPSSLETLDKNSKEALKNILEANDEIFYFNHDDFEKIDKNNLIAIKKAIKEKRTLSFEYYYLKKEHYKIVAPLRILFNKNNWYLLGFLDEKVKFFRINFMKNIEFNESINISKSQKEKIKTYIKNIQNPMTLYGVENKKAIIQASKNIAIYFQKDSKKFFSSQKFLQENSDGSVEFELLYTQVIEILPFIQSWIPNMRVLKPPELEKEFLIHLQNAIKLQLKGNTNV